MKKIFALLFMIISVNCYSQSVWHLLDEYVVEKDSLTDVQVNSLLEVYSHPNSRLVFAVVLNNDTTKLYGESLMVIPKDCEFKVFSDCNKLSITTSFPFVKNGDKISLMVKSRQKIDVKHIINIVFNKNIIYDSEFKK